MKEFLPSELKKKWLKMVIIYNCILKKKHLELQYKWLQKKKKENFINLEEIFYLL